MFGSFVTECSFPRVLDNSINIKRSQISRCTAAADLGFVYDDPCFILHSPALCDRERTEPDSGTSSRRSADLHEGAGSTRFARSRARELERLRTVHIHFQLETGLQCAVYEQ